MKKETKRLVQQSATLAAAAFALAFSAPASATAFGFHPMNPGTRNPVHPIHTVHSGNIGGKIGGVKPVPVFNTHTPPLKTHTPPLKKKKVGLNPKVATPGDSSCKATKDSGMMGCGIA